MTSIILPRHRIDLVDQRLHRRDARIVFEVDQRSARAPSRLVQPELAIGDAQLLAAFRAVDQRDDVVEFAGHAAILSQRDDSGKIINPAAVRARGDGPLFEERIAP